MIFKIEKLKHNNLKKSLKAVEENNRILTIKNSEILICKELLLVRLCNYGIWKLIRGKFKIGNIFHLIIKCPKQRNRK